MNTFEAAALGLVQGLTEFLPVSSSAHLLFAQEFLGVNRPGLHLEVAAHLGTVGAVLAHNRRDFAEMAAGVLRGGPARRTAGLVVLATSMLVLVVLARKAFPEVKAWRDSPLVACAGLGGVGLFLLATKFARRGTDMPGSRAAIGMGLAQCVAAVVTGCSRSGSTIGTGILLGVDPGAAARFSFLMSVPAVLGASIYDLRDEGLPPAADAVPLAVAALVALVSGWLAIRALLRIVGRGSLHTFGWYCLAVSAAAAAALQVRG
ncbi:MAG: Undecaprenyl-diphosphatase [Planctomycetes bacterium]|nr:Undecaprenyl-diphosphatase [Planctomycetota bacterium]